MRRTTRLPYAGFAFVCLTLWAPLATGQPAATLAHASCSAYSGGITYFSAAFSAPFEKDARGEQNYHTAVTWGRAFADYVEQKYGGTKGSASGSCGLVTSLERAQGNVPGRIAAAKRLGQKVVETDWVYKSAVPSTPQAAQPVTSPGQTPPPNASAQGTTMQAVCWSDLNAPVIYISQVFDTRMGRPDQGEDVFSPVSNEFHQYLKGRYDYKSSATRGAHCVGQMSQAGSSAQRSRIMTEFATGKRVVELEWAWSPDTADPRGATVLDGGYCTTSGTTGTVYVAGPFDLKGRVATSEWNRAFSQLLTSKYAFKGEVDCPIGMPRSRAQRWYSFHVQGARAGNKRVVETGWELGAVAASSAAGPPNEQKDREPARPPAAAPTPSQDVREFATKEVPEVMAYCQKERMTQWAFDCGKVQRAVYNYRMAHAADGTPEPLTSLLAGDKLDCSSCVDNMRTPGWAKQQAHSQGNTPAVVACVEQKIVAQFLTKPYFSRIKEAFDATLAACKR